MMRTKLGVIMLVKKLIILGGVVISLGYIMSILILSPEDALLVFIGFVIFLPSAILCFYGFLVYQQLAILDDKGIVIKDIFKVISKVKWEEIKDVKIEMLTTYIGSRCPWIVIFTDINQTRIPNISTVIGDLNEPNNPPYKIKASKKNVRIMNEYLRKYRSDLWVHLDKNKPNTKHY